MEAHTRARKLIDDAHAGDPKRTADGRPAELVYADRMEAWVVRAAAEPTPLLRLAARCQHLERWSVPRDTFPMDRPGYLKWRQSLYKKQAARAQELMLQAGMADAEAAEAATWVAKIAPKTNAGTQALEDAACLVFLENEIEEFATQHADYPREKFVDIIRKTWKKMSPRGQNLAKTIALPPAIGSLVTEAITGA
jgi:tRNAThr (cytosine32-N3)-methyltransferase